MGYDFEHETGVERAVTEVLTAIEGFCELCETEGHTVRICPTRDDDFSYEEDDK